MRMSRYSAVLAKKIGLPMQEVLNIFYAAPCMTSGKSASPTTIISKPSKLTSDEFDIIKKHTVIGAEILDNSKSNILNDRPPDSAVAP